MHYQKTLQFLQILQIAEKKICEKRARVPSYKDKINPLHLNKGSFYTQTAIQRYQKTAEIVEKVEKPPTNVRKQEDAITFRYNSINRITDSDMLDSRWLCYNFTVVGCLFALR